jgi:hypothetical protein
VIASVAAIVVDDVIAPVAAIVPVDTAGVVMPVAVMDRPVAEIVPPDSASEPAVIAPEPTDKDAPDIAPMAAIVVDDVIAPVAAIVPVDVTAGVVMPVAVIDRPVAEIVPPDRASEPAVIAPEPTDKDAPDIAPEAVTAPAVVNDPAVMPPLDVNCVVCIDVDCNTVTPLTRKPPDTMLIPPEKTFIPPDRTCRPRPCCPTIILGVVKPLLDVMVTGEPKVAPTPSALTVKPPVTERPAL